jgi:hypothetical protein
MFKKILRNRIQFQVQSARPVSHNGLYQYRATNFTHLNILYLITISVLDKIQKKAGTKV